MSAFFPPLGKWQFQWSSGHTHVTSRSRLGMIGLENWQVSMSHTALTETYEQLLQINQRMMESRHYEVAFHTLEAAMHCAGALKDEQQLIAIQQAAEGQRALIDTEAPNHRMSTQTAAVRGGQNLYALLVRQIDVLLNQIRHDQRQQRLGLPKLHSDE